MTASLPNAVLIVVTAKVTRPFVYRIGTDPAAHEVILDPNVDQYLVPDLPDIQPYLFQQARETYGDLIATAAYPDHAKNTYPQSVWRVYFNTVIPATAPKALDDLPPLGYVQPFVVIDSRVDGPHFPEIADLVDDEYVERACATDNEGLRALPSARVREVLTHQFYSQLEERFAATPPLPVADSARGFMGKWLKGIERYIPIPTFDEVSGKSLPGHGVPFILIHSRRLLATDYDTSHLDWTRLKDEQKLDMYNKVAGNMRKALRLLDTLVFPHPPSPSVITRSLTVLMSFAGSKVSLDLHKFIFSKLAADNIPPLPILQVDGTPDPSGAPQFQFHDSLVRAGLDYGWMRDVITGKRIVSGAGATYSLEPNRSLRVLHAFALPLSNPLFISQPSAIPNRLSVLPNEVLAQIISQLPAADDRTRLCQAAHSLFKNIISEHGFKSQERVWTNSRFLSYQLEATRGRICICCAREESIVRRVSSSGRVYVRKINKNSRGWVSAGKMHGNKDRKKAGFKFCKKMYCPACAAELRKKHPDAAPRDWIWREQGLF